jgi:hypothetical protein
MQSDDRRQSPVVAGHRAARRRENSVAPAPVASGSEKDERKGISRRDLLVAGFGLATGVASTVVTSLVVERLGPAVATSNLEAFPTIDWAPDGSWLFFADDPIDLADQPDDFSDDDGDWSQAAIDYVVKRDCVRGSPLIVQLHLSRPGNAPAVVRDIRVVDHRTGPALTGASYFSETAGSNQNTVLGVDLDANRPVAVEATIGELLYEGDIGGRPPAFSHTTFSIEPHLTETLTIGFITHSGRHSFRLAIDYFVEGRDHSLIVPVDDDLLRVTQVTEAGSAYVVPWYEGVHRYVPGT